MRRFVWILAIMAVLLVIAFATLVEWGGASKPPPPQEHMTLSVSDA